MVNIVMVDIEVKTEGWVVERRGASITVEVVRPAPAHPRGYEVLGRLAGFVIPYDELPGWSVRVTVDGELVHQSESLSLHDGTEAAAKALERAARLRWPTGRA